MNRKNDDRPQPEASAPPLDVLSPRARRHAKILNDDAIKDVTVDPPVASAEDAEPGPVLELTFGKRSTQSIWNDVREITIENLAEMLSKPELGKKDGPCFTPATFSGDRRNAKDAVRISIASLDIDCGHTLEEIKAGLSKQGLRAVVQSTYNHLTTETLVKAEGFDAWQKDNPQLTVEEYLLEKEGYLPRVLEGAEFTGEERIIDGNSCRVVRIQLCPKFRILLPMKEPWLISNYGSWRDANAAWKKGLEALAHQLGMRHDPKCVDLARLFFLPRLRSDDAVFDFADIPGEPVDLFALSAAVEEARVPEQTGTREITTLQPRRHQSSGRDLRKVLAKDGETFDVMRWAGEYARGFEIAQALKAKAPHIFTERVGGDGTKPHIRCPHEHEHISGTGDETGTFVCNASQTEEADLSEIHGFVILCSHAGCDRFDRLDHLAAMLEQGTLTPDDLYDKRFLRWENPANGGGAEQTDKTSTDQEVTKADKLNGTASGDATPDHTTASVEGEPAGPDKEKSKQEKELAAETPNHTSARYRPHRNLNRDAPKHLDLLMPVFFSEAARLLNGNWVITPDPGSTIYVEFRAAKEDGPIRNDNPHCVVWRGPERNYFVFIDAVMEFGNIASMDRVANKLAKLLGTNVLPLLEIKVGDIGPLVDKAEKALIASNPDLYVHGSQIVRPQWATATAVRGGITQTFRLPAVNATHLLERFEDVCIFETFNKTEKTLVAVNCPTKVPNVYIARNGSWKLKNLTAVSTVPVLLSDGRLIDEPGYDDATGILYNPAGVVFSPIPENPTRHDARAALALLKEIITKFDFVGDADRSVALSGIITAVTRRGMDVAPLHGFDAPVAGSGKSKLTDIASVIATGWPAAVTGVGHDGRSNAELEKRLDASLIAGEAIVSLDNLEYPLGGQVMNQVLTQPKIRPRILGKSENAEVWNKTTFFATGNNLKIFGDMTRRCLIGRLDPRCERPELRKFDFEPVTLAMENRGKYVVAVLTIVRAYIVAGKPKMKDVAPLGSYEQWCDLVRYPLIWLGEADPVSTIEKVRGADPELSAKKAVMEAWKAAIGAGKRMLVREIIEKAQEQERGTTGGFNQGQTLKCPELRDALELVAASYGAGPLSPQKIGMWLSSVEDNRVRLEDGLQYCFRQAGGAHGTKMWLLEQITEGSP